MRTGLVEKLPQELREEENSGLFTKSPLFGNPILTLPLKKPPKANRVLSALEGMAY